MNKIEEWRVIEEAPRYLVSNKGRIQNQVTGRILKPGVNSDGYLTVILALNDGPAISRKVHRLVALAFLEIDDIELEVNHIDGNKTNANVENLEWCTRSENQRHAFAIGLYQRRGGKIRIIETGEIFETQRECANAINGDQSAVCEVLGGRRKRHKGHTFKYVEPRHMAPELMDHQIEAVENLSNGKILYGMVGTGKTLTALAYYMKKEAPKDIYVITPAKHRDSLYWEGEAAKFGISTEDYCTLAGIITVDSWNNIKNYTEIEDAFFIFDENRLVGSGEWVKAFLKITKKNNWIILTATPGDNFMDYIPVFVANGYYKNRTEFKRKHVIYDSYYTKYPKIKGYINEFKLQLLRNELLVEMPFIKHTIRHMNYTDVGYDKRDLNRIQHDRWNIFEQRPIKDAAEKWRLMRRVINQDPSRIETLRQILTWHPRLICFYNFNYELNILLDLAGEISTYQYNGHVHDPIPTGDRWIFLVQYVAGAEGWNLTSTDAMVLYSLPDSYKNFSQCLGRIDRLDTPYTDLYYYILVSNSIVDVARKASLEAKKNFNEKRFIREMEAIEGG